MRIYVTLLITLSTIDKAASFNFFKVKSWRMRKTIKSAGDLQDITGLWRVRDPGWEIPGPFHTMIIQSWVIPFNSCSTIALPQQYPLWKLLC